MEPVGDTEAVVVGDGEPVPSRGLGDDEPEPLAAGVAVLHMVTVNEAVEDTEVVRVAAREGEEEGDAWMDALPVEDAELHTETVADKAAEKV